jgi:tRNA/rRNA methyltransferase
MPDRVNEIDVVLVRPLRPANVAAACRALKNMGQQSLVLVQAPAIDAEARALAYGAWDVLDGARREKDLRSAVARATFVVGTSGKSHENAWSPRRLAAESASRAQGGRTAVVFGPEASGLTLDELQLCHEVVHIPTSPAHPSLNLAQAVLIVAYEIFLAPGPAEGNVPVEVPAPAGEQEAVLRDLREALLAIGFLNPQNPDLLLGEIRRLLARSRPTLREASLLRGLARQIRWAGTR